MKKHIGDLNNTKMKNKKVNLTDKESTELDMFAKYGVKSIQIGNIEYKIKHKPKSSNKKLSLGK